MPKRKIIIGLDGVPYELIQEFSSLGIMPNMGSLISEGTLSRMFSSLPEISSVAWSSIITGANPAEHGIFGFTDFYPNSYKIRFPNFNDLKKEPFWSGNGLQSVIINVPSTYPVRPMNGAHISGFVSVDLARSIYPAVILEDLKTMDYRLDVNSEAAHKSMDLFLSDLDLTLNARVKAYRYLWDNFNWQLFMLVFTGTDRLMHFLWDAYEDENNIYHDKFLEHFKKIDKVIGEIASRMGKEDILIMLSDHGFEKLELDIYINYVLKKEGFLQFKDSQDHDFSNIGHSTKAFALDPARIYINLKDKYPDGGVDILERDRILQDLILLFKELELNGNKVIKDVYRKEDIYKGEYFDSAPDLVLLGNKGFNLKGNIKANKLYDKAIFTGKHSYDNAFFMLKGNNNCLLPDNLAVYDVKRIIEAV